MNTRTTEFVEDIIEMAGFGISYWAIAASADSKAKTYTVSEGDDFGDPASNPEDYEHAVLTYDQILTAACDLIDGNVHAYTGIVESLVRRDVDSEAADAVIQVAMFNEIRYG